MPIVTASDIQGIRNLLSDRLGMAFSGAEYQALQATIDTELENLNLDCVSDYLNQLHETDLESSIWQRLIKTLTNPESYFFREQGQIQLLREQILPELIQQRSPHKQLKIWSAGCATGEEVYSLAMLLMELIPDIETWDIKIIGTDINTTALAIAATGEYQGWSWRLPEPTLRNKYFQDITQGTKYHRYQVVESLRRLVQFLPLNLLDQPSPQTFENIDLILCRHVFIHWKTAAIAKVLQHFQQALRGDGYLMTGHSELYGMELPKLRAQVFSGSFVYQRQPEAPTTVTLLPLPSLNLNQRSPAVPKRKLRLSDPIFTQQQATQKHSGQPAITTSRQHHRYHQAIARLNQQLLGSISNHNPFQTHYTLACLHGWLGQYESARHHGLQAIECNHMSELPNYLLAQIAIAQGKYNEAKRLLHRILFFNNASALAYYELAQIHGQEQDGDRAQFFEQKAWQYLQSLDPDHLIDPFGERTVRQLNQEINNRLALSS